MAKGLIDSWLDNIFDADWVGRHGEKLTVRELRLVKSLGRSGQILRNVYVPKANGDTSEIDVIFITQKGIFVIESKNYSGWIFGDEKAGYWTAMLPNKLKNKFYNPIKQNTPQMAEGVSGRQYPTFFHYRFFQMFRVKESNGGKLGYSCDQTGLAVCYYTGNLGAVRGPS